MSYQLGHVDRDERIDLAADEPLGEPTRRSGLPTPLLTALIMAAFAGGLWFAYHLGTHHAVSTPAAPGAVPLLHADTQPMKVKPEQPGGTAVPGSDRLIYNEQPGGPPVEKLLPPPEQPMPRPTPPPASAVASAPAALPAPVASPPAAALSIPAPPPRKPVPPIRSEATTPARHLPAVRPYPAPAAEQPLHRSPAVRSSAAPDLAPRELAGGPVRIQLASLRSVDAARIEWQRLKRENPDLLGRLTADAVRADLGQRGVYYRIEAGTFAHPGTAEHLCRELRQRRVECSIVR